GVQVDESGREHPAPTVHHPVGRMVREVPDRGDAVTGHGDVAPAGGGSGTVDDGHVTEQQVGHQGFTRDPGRRRTVPGRAPVWWPASTTTSPLTRTWSTPTGAAAGFSNVARSITVS